jgi:type IV secretory pathway TrbL component
MKRDKTMKRTTLYATLIGALMVSAAAFGISAAVDSPRSLMAPIDYGTAKKAIEADIRVSIAKCRDQAGQARDLCKAEARADERVRKADLEAQYRGTVVAAADAKLARAKAQYDVAKVRCGDQHGEGKVSCIRSARADKARALADAKLASN